MTSWIKQGLPKKKEEEPRRFLFETTDDGLCSQFNAYLYSLIYSVIEGAPLIVNDTVNAVSMRYPLIQNTFQRVNTVEFTDTNLLNVVSLKKKRQTVLSFVAGMQPDKIQSYGRLFLQWNVNALQETDASGIDVGVHLRTFASTEGKNPPIDTYVKAIQAFQKNSKKTALTVFVMADSSVRLEEFRRKKDPSWTMVTVGNPPAQYSQRDYNAAPQRVRLTAYKDLLTELQTMQQIPQVFCTFSSNVGKFLYLTASPTQTVQSLDEPFLV